MANDIKLKYPYPYENNAKYANNIALHQTILPNGYRERLYAFAPTGLCANLIARNYYTMLQIGKWLFCHGSPTLHVSKKYSIDLINNITALYLLGIDTKTMKIEKHFNTIMRPNHNIIAGHEIENSILWSRTFGESISTDTHTDRQTQTQTYRQTHIDTEANYTEKDLSKLLTQIMSVYNTTNNNKTTDLIATHIAIGHTPQFDQGINAICNNRVWRCDVGMSKAFKNNDADVKNGHIQVLEIINGIPSILS